MLEKYNKEDNSYTHYISEFEKFCEGVKKISNRIKYKTFGEEPNKSDFNEEYHLIIDDAESFEDCIKTQMDGKMESLIGMYHSSLFLECCLQSAGFEGIEYLINRYEIMFCNSPRMSDTPTSKRIKMARLPDKLLLAMKTM